MAWRPPITSRRPMAAAMLRDRERLARGRQYRPQHHGRALQLLLSRNVALYDLALRLYEGLSRDLNFNVMLSQRGILNISHTPAQIEIGDAAHQRHAAQRRRRRVLGPGPVRGRLPLMTSARFALPAMAASGSRAAASPATTRSHGPMRAPPTGSASTSSRIARSPASSSERRLRRGRDDVGEIRAEAVGVAVAGHSSGWARRASSCRSIPMRCRRW